MKKRNRIMSFVCAIALVFSITVVPAAAVDYTGSQDPLMAAVMAADDYEEFYTENGLVKVMTATVPTSLLEMNSRMVIDNPMGDPIVDTATWNEPGEFTFNCRNGLGRYCRLVATNTDDSTTLEAVYSCVISGENVTIEENITPGNSRVTLFQSNTTAHLTLSIDILLSPVRAVSVDYEFLAEQY